MTAGLLAKKQGAPLGRFLAATNRNDVFGRWLASGRLRPQAAVATPSNAMDVGDPSNAARIQALKCHAATVFAQLTDVNSHRVVFTSPVAIGMAQELKQRIKSMGDEYGGFANADKSINTAPPMRTGLRRPIWSET